jgi:hypothetical protein
MEVLQSVPNCFLPSLAYHSSSFTILFVTAGVASPTSVVLELLYHEDVEGALALAFEFGRHFAALVLACTYITRSH